MPTVERNFLHGFVVDNLPRAGGSDIDKRGLGGDHNFFPGFSDFQLNVLGDRGRHLKFEVGDFRRLKVGCGHLDAIHPDRERREKIRARIIHLRDRCHSSALVCCGHRGIGDNRS